ncbi:MAG TPA: M28 family peptidase [Gemmataceae bacterium]|nr:M28 family peptidase [Gemmataceae bacterium]
MLVAHSKNRRPNATDAAIAEVLRGVSADKLRAYVDVLAFPRHYIVERKANRHARDLLLRLLRGFGYAPVLQGSYDNIVAVSCSSDNGPFLLLGAHYDSVPGCPGADDNASAVAVCLECARLLKENEVGKTMVVLFNREEDGMLGSQEFVAHLAGQPAGMVEEAHIFEMVGYCNRAPGSQRMPPGLPGVAAPDVGDFLGLLANRYSNTIAEKVLALAATYLPQFPVLALKIYLGMERYFRDLLRSDHAPFWAAGIPAIMWTDTSEFRNPHYHRVSDTPQTLDYDFLANVAKLALARAVSRTEK